jgi:hypothetical protein
MLAGIFMSTRSSLDSDRDRPCTDRGHVVLVDGRVDREVLRDVFFRLALSFDAIQENFHDDFDTD